MLEYTTIQGDTWDGISYKLYGDSSRMSELMERNTAHIRTTIFSAGVVLQVPEAEPQISNNLPPWKRDGES